MPLSPGRRLGAFEILSPLGSGGMGEVYRARDHRLGREVAVKVLPEAFVRDPERLARFEREARLLASLNHPSIAAIHGLEEQDGVRFLVLELVEGETLAERLVRGPLPLEESLEICRQVTEALEAAHAKNVIHRDLKPANIKVTPEGRAKVLDFGLAKAWSGDSSSQDPSDSPTESHLATSDGIILGTAAYMSPEQARGLPLDKRSDIWSFGCILYEVVTGRRAFGGETVSDSLVAVLGRDPDWGDLPRSTPPLVQYLLRRCLQRDRNRRLSDIVAARIEIEEALVQLSSGASMAMFAPSGRRRGWPRQVLAFLAGAAAVGLGVWLWPHRAPSAWFPKRLSLHLSPAAPLVEVWSASAVTLSPDGRSIVYAAIGGGRSQLYLRRMDELEATPVQGTEGGLGGFFSPDGEWLGFWAEGKVKKVPVKGGEVRTICDAPSLRGASWGPDRTILLTPASAQGLHRVSADGGTPQLVTTPDPARKEMSHRWPQFLPGGKAALFSTMTQSLRDDERAVAVVDLKTNKWRVLVEGGTFPRYSPTGHLLYARGGTLFAAPFDVDRLALTGPAVPVLENLRMEVKGTGVAHLDMAGGALLYVPGTPAPPDRSLVWVDRKGGVRPITESRRPYRNPVLSPDGTRLAVRIEGASDDVWVYDLGRETWTRLTFEGDNQDPVWLPDGKRLVFSSNRMGSFNLFSIPADGSGAPERLTEGMGWLMVRGVSPDGKALVYDEINPVTGNDSSLLPLDGDRTPRPLLNTPFFECCPRFSPDGRWLAYVSAESGREQIYVRPYPGPGRKYAISKEGGLEPVWSPTGRELFYRNGRRLMAVPVQAGAEFSAGAPQVLNETPYEWGYDVAADGQRFVMVRGPEKTETALELVVVPDWSAELLSRVRGR